MLDLPVLILLILFLVNTMHTIISQILYPSREPFFEELGVQFPSLSGNKNRPEVVVLKMNGLSRTCPTGVPAAEPTNGCSPWSESAQSLRNLCDRSQTSLVASNQ